MPELARACGQAEVQGAAEHEAAADARATDDAHHVLRTSPCTKFRFGERERMTVVDEAHRSAETVLQRPAQWLPRPVAVQVREQFGDAVLVEEPWERDADRVDGSDGTAELDESLQDGSRSILGTGRRLTPLSHLVVLEHHQLDVRPAEIEAEASHRAVQPPSTVSTAPVTNGAVAR